MLSTYARKNTTINSQPYIEETMNAQGTQKTGRQRLEEASESASFAWQSLFLDITEKVLRRMKQIGKKKADLARSLDTTPSYISQIFSGSTNLTLETVAKLAHAVDAEAHIELRPRIRRHEWRRTYDSWSMEGTTTEPTFDKSAYEKRLAAA